MKIGIITLAGGANFGCQLQNLAVKKAYEELGYEALTILDSTRMSAKDSKKVSSLSKLRPSYIYKVLSVRLKRKFHIKNQSDKLIPCAIKSRKEASLLSRLEAERQRVFKDFFDNVIGHTDFYININDVPYEKLGDFDFFSAGSDQLWNPTYPSTSGIKFLSFTQRNKKLTFAPSFGISELPAYTKEAYGKWLSDFNLLCVREQKGAEIIKELTGKEAEVICDPTITVSRDVWESFEKKPAFDTDTPYALTYFLGNKTNAYRRFIEKTCKAQNLRIINLFDIWEAEHFTAGPAEFLYLVHNAKAVFTDSFHAAVFSIIYEKDFMVFDRVEDGRSMSSRLHTLLHTFSLTDRMFEKGKTFTPVDFSHTPQIIKREKEKAFDFLRRSIETNLQSRN